MDEDTKHLISQGGKVRAHMKEQMPSEFTVKGKNQAAVDAVFEQLQQTSDALDESRSKTEKLESAHEALKAEAHALIVDYRPAVQGWVGKSSSQYETAPTLYEGSHSHTAATPVPVAPTKPAGQS